MVLVRRRGALRIASFEEELGGQGARGDRGPPHIPGRRKQGRKGPWLIRSVGRSQRNAYCHEYTL